MTQLRFVAIASGTLALHFALLSLLATIAGGANSASPIVQRDGAAPQSSAFQKENTGKTHFEDRIAQVLSTAADLSVT